MTYKHKLGPPPGGGSYAGRPVNLNGKIIGYVTKDVAPGWDARRGDRLTDYHFTPSVAAREDMGLKGVARITTMKKLRQKIEEQL